VDALEHIMATHRRVASRCRPLVRGAVDADRIDEPRTSDAAEEREPEQLSFDF